MVLHLAQPISADDPLLLSFTELSDRPRYTGDEKRRLGRKPLSKRLTMPFLCAAFAIVRDDTPFFTGTNEGEEAA